MFGSAGSARLVRMKMYNAVLNGHPTDVGYMGYPPDSEFLLHLRERWLCVPETHMDIDACFSLQQQPDQSERYEHSRT